jgi:hypothetical protein
MGGWKVGKQMQGLKLGSSESNVWHSGLPATGPIRPSLPWCLRPAKGSLDGSRAARKPAARGRRQVGSWQCRQRQGLEVVARQFRKQRLALWAAGRGPDPSFTATWCLSPAKGSLDQSRAARKLAAPAARGRRQVGSWQCRRTGKSKLVASHSESNVWQSGLPAAGPRRPSLPWCLSPATGSLDRSRAARKPAARGRRQVGPLAVQAKARFGGSC